MTWVYLAGAIFTEVAATLVLKVASAGRPRLYTFVVAGYATAFLFLVRTSTEGWALASLRHLGGRGGCSHRPHVEVAVRRSTHAHGASRHRADHRRRSVHRARIELNDGTSDEQRPGLSAFRAEDDPQLVGGRMGVFLQVVRRVDVGRLAQVLTRGRKAHGSRLVLECGEGEEQRRQRSRIS